MNGDLNMYQPKALGCKASVTLYKVQVRRIEWKKQQKKKTHHNTKDLGGADTTTAKDRYRELLHWSQKG